MVQGSPAENAVAADLASARFKAGEIRRYWRKVSFQFPLLIIAVSAIEPDGKPAEYFFRFELTGFPGAAPEVRTWDYDSNVELPAHRRPKGSPRVNEAFKSWGPQTVYRPWERHAGAHGEWSTKYPDLAWNSKRDLSFVLEDLHGLLTSNGAACSAGPAT